MERATTHPSAADDAFWAPGTIQLTDGDSTKEALLHPTPTTDPNDPLNWSDKRKALNFSLLCFYVLWTFVQLDVGYTAWGPMQDELGFSDDELNIGAAMNYGGLAVGCILFMPFVHKYGRRPLYIFSSAAQLAGAIWYAKTLTYTDLIGSNLISGLSGAISETIVQLTVADIFFVHQHATMTGAYLMCMAVGAFLGPVASGYIVEGQGWRWVWWWCVIFLSINLVLVLFFFEESKYVPKPNHHVVAGTAASGKSEPGSRDSATEMGATEPTGKMLLSRVQSQSRINRSTAPKTYRQRMALASPSPGSFGHHFYQPIIILFTFPAVAYTALTYGCALASFGIMTSMQATYLILPPYNFGAIGVGLMNIAPFVGAIPGMIVGGWLNDKWIMWLSKRNQGVYEPEMRLWFVFLATLLLPAGILMFGLGLVRGAHWAELAFGLGLYGFAFVLCGDIVLNYTTDCYQDMIGDALVGIVFCRNLLPLVAVSVLTPWTDAMGIQGVHILTAAVCFGILLIQIVLIIWGKKARAWTSKRYIKMALRQPVHRTVGNH